jgi:hypothetical protein
VQNLVTSLPAAEKALSEGTVPLGIDKTSIAVREILLN